MSQDSLAPISYQTIQLSRGKHTSPEDGACVMELASLLAEEPFSDQPRSVCPVIAAFLRRYNDSLDDRRRQDLYGCVAQVLGTRSTPEVQHQRIERCAAWAGEMWRTRSWLTRAFTRPRVGGGPLSAAEAAGAAAVKAIPRHTDATHEAALALIDALCEIGREDRHADLPVGESIITPPSRATAGAA